MSSVLVGLAAWAAFCLGFLAGGIYAVGMTMRKIERSDERMRTLCALDEALR